MVESFASNTYQIGSRPDGLNINLNVGSTHFESIINAVKNNCSDIGLSFDGDGDSLLVVDKDGTIFDGDYIVYMIAKYLKSKGNDTKSIKRTY